jgi:hypothetical protein
MKPMRIVFSFISGFLDTLGQVLRYYGGKVKKNRAENDKMEVKD